MRRVHALGRIGNKCQFERVFVDLIVNAVGHLVEPHALPVTQGELLGERGIGIAGGHFNSSSSRGGHWADAEIHGLGAAPWIRSEEHTSELQSLMRISYAVF